MPPANAREQNPCAPNISAIPARLGTERDSKRQALEQSLTEERERQMTRIRAAAADEKARLMHFAIKNVMPCVRKLQAGTSGFAGFSVG